MADTWPPEPFDIAFARFRELDAWWTGDTATLAEIYSGRDGATHTVNGQPYRGGVRGTLSKWWHGQPIVQGESRMKSHLPVAADLCTLSADLLFGEAPQVVFRKPDNVAPKKDATGKPIKWRHPAQDRLDAILGTDDSHAELLLGGELAAAHGAVYISVAWDPQISDHVFPKVYAADCAIPVFRHGRLAGVRLWSEYRDGNEVYRLIESHEPGWVEYALYRGGDKTLGDLVPIASRPETAHYEQLRNESDMAVALANPGALPLSVRIGTGSKRLAVTYMKNAVPVRDWRKLGPLAHLGRSDLDGIQDELDKIDMAWSSLWRDIENGQGRLIVAEEALDLTGSPGEGAKFDPYRNVFTAIGATLGKAADGGRLVDEVQFDIRVTEHLEAIEAALKRIGSTLGYSEPHLGIDASRGGQTATEITADLSDSERTRDKKAIFARSAIAQWARVALEIDHAVHGGDALGDLDVLPDVVFAPISQADPEKLTRIAALMEGIASLKERVRVQHPDWDDDEVAAEVEEIKTEQKALRDATPDPASFGGDDPDDEKHDGAEASDEK